MWCDHPKRKRLERWPTGHHPFAGFGHSSLRIDMRQWPVYLNCDPLGLVDRRSMAEGVSGTRFFRSQTLIGTASADSFIFRDVIPFYASNVESNVGRSPNSTTTILESIPNDTSTAHSQPAAHPEIIGDVGLPVWMLSGRPRVCDARIISSEKSTAEPNSNILKPSHTTKKVFPSQQIEVGLNDLFEPSNPAENSGKKHHVRSPDPESPKGGWIPRNTYDRNLILRALK